MTIREWVTNTKPHKTDNIITTRLAFSFPVLQESMEGKLEALELQNTRLKAGNEDLLKQLAEVNARLSSLSSEESERQKHLDKLTTSLNIVQRQASISEKEVDELRRQVQEETMVRFCRFAWPTFL